MLKTPQKEREDFLAPLDSLVQKVLQEGESSLTTSEWPEYIRRQDEIFELRKRYEGILIQMPRQWNSYCKGRLKEFKDSMRIAAGYAVPKPIEGRPRKNDLAYEMVELNRAGLSNPKIAQRLNREHGEGTATTDSVRKLIKSRMATSPPDKTSK